MVIVASPEEPLGSAGDGLAQWIADDGKALVLADPSSTVDVSNLTSSFGLTIKHGIVFEGDPEAIVSGDHASPIVRRYSSANPVVRNGRATLRRYSLSAVIGWRGSF